MTSTESFYTNFVCLGNQILYRGIEAGERVSKKLSMKPSLFVPSTKSTKWKTLDGKSVDKITFSSINEARDFIKKYSEVDNFVFFGNTKFQYVYIGDTFPQLIDYNIEKLVIANIDIEVTSEIGFAPPENPFESVVAITLEVGGIYYVFGCGEFTTQQEGVHYIKCVDETELLRKFLEHWDHISPDIVTGWNVQFYDIPYLVNRITKILGEKSAKMLSPWRIISTKTAFYKGKEQTAIELVGIGTLDYIDLYRRYGTKQESEKLNYIAYVELGERKISYEEYGNLHSLYKNNFQKFIEYNIKDVQLVKKLEEKLKLIEMVVAIAYDAKVNFTDVSMQVRMWDAIIFNHLKSKNIVVPQMANSHKDSMYAGAYVKTIIPGMYEWVVSFDLNSLYPNLISQFNISPECFVPSKFRQVTVDALLDMQIDTSDLADQGLGLAANGHCFSNERVGFLPEILMRMYEERKLYKDKMLDAKRELERVNEEIHRRGL